MRFFKDPFSAHSCLLSTLAPLALLDTISNYHLYADDTHIYVSLSLKNPDISLEIISKYLLDVSSWMSQGRLKINPDNTELLLIGSKVKGDLFRNVLQQDCWHRK